MTKFFSFSIALRKKEVFASFVKSTKCKRSFCIVSSSDFFRNIVLRLLCNKAPTEQVIKSPQTADKTQENVNDIFKKRNRQRTPKEERKKVKIKSEIKAVFFIWKFLPFFIRFKLEKLKKIYYNRRKRRAKCA